MRNETLEQPFEQTASVAPGGRFTLTNTTGENSVEPWAEDTIQISATKKAVAQTTEEAQTILDKIDIEVTELSGNVNVNTVLPQGLLSGQSASVAYVIKVPASVQLRLNSTTGAINVDGVNGDSVLNATTGNITASNLGGNLNAETTTGIILASDVIGSVTANATTGNITASNLSGSLDAEATTGNIKALEVVGPFNGEATTGNINATVTGTSLNKNTVVKTTTGLVALTLSGSLAAGINAETKTGIITNSLTITASIDTDTKLVGDLNGGGNTIRIRTNDGNITLGPI